jgi:hypothetical protein
MSSTPARCGVLAGAVLLAVSSIDGQSKTPDFSGVWTYDAARSEAAAAAHKLEITQSADQVQVRQFLCCRQEGEIWTISYYFNQWGPRSAMPRHIPQNVARRDTKPTQARWDGDRLVLHAGPDLDTRGGSVRMWRLSADQRDLVEETVNRGLGRDFDFREASIPRTYARDRHVYTRSSAAH